MSTSILQLASSGQADKVLRDMRVRSLFSPYYFIKLVLGYPHLVEHFHNRILEEFITNWEEGITKQCLEIPRGFFKSTMMTIGTGIWGVLPFNDEDILYAVEELHLDPEAVLKRFSLHDQDCTNLLAFETLPNAEKKIAEIKHHFEENILFRMLFPEITYQGTESPWNTKCLRIRRVGFGQRQPEGTFEAIGVEGALQSRHYKRVWEDDLVGKAATESRTTMESTIRWHGLLSGAFEDATKQVRFVISNRWGYEDLNGYIRKHEPDFHFFTAACWETDPATGLEKATFPERYSMEALFKIRDTGSMSRFDFNCQYVNKPILPGEQEIDLNALHTYIVEEDGKIACSCGSSFYPSQLLRFLHYDPYNAKGARSSSCPAIAVVGCSVDKHVVLLDYYTAKGSYIQVFDNLFRLGKKWKPSKLTYEDVGAQNMAEFYIKQRQQVAGYEGYSFKNIQPVPTKGKPFEVRVRDYLMPILRGEGGRKFTRRKTHLLFESQLESFPSASFEHDYDLLDALTQGTQVWRFPLSFEEQQQSKQDDTKAIARINTPYTHLKVTA